MATATSSQADDETWHAIWKAIKTGMTLLKKWIQVTMEVHNVVKMKLMTMTAPCMLLEACYIY